jgi:hypothetical protein
MKLTPEAMAYGDTRGISEQTLTKMLVIGGVKFPDARGFTGASRD